MAGARRAGAWQNDTFLNDFLYDTNQIEVDPDDSAPGGCSDLDFLSSADISLSSYLSGETSEVESDLQTNNTVNTNTGTGGTTSGHSGSFSLSPRSTNKDVDSTQTHSQRSIIVVTRPVSNSNSKIKGNSFSKHAIAARENRQKKKQYVSSLESSVQKLSEENELLKKQDAEQKRQILKYQEEVKYLKSVIINESGLSALLRNIQNTRGVKLSSSLLAMAETNENLCSTSGVDIPGQKRKQSVDSKDCSGLTSIDQPSSSKRVHFSSARNVTAPSTNSAVHQLHRLPVPDNEGSFIDLTHTDSHDHANNAKENMQTDIQYNCIHKQNDDRNGCNVGGICLHVLGDSVSIELCSSCSVSAMRSCNTDHAYSRSSP